MTAFLYVLSGFLVGGMVGLSGVGGGSLMTPLLILLFGQTPGVAVGTDLLFAAATKVVATGTFQAGKRVEWRIVIRMLCGSVPATLLMSVWLWHARAAGIDLGADITRILAVVLLLTAITLLMPFPQVIRDSALATRWCDAVERHETLWSVLLGVFLGAIITLTSIGAGAFGIFALSILYPRRLAADRLVATDIAHALPVALLAGISHVMMGEVDFSTLKWLLLGSIPGVYLASRATMRLPPRIVRGIIGILLGVVSGRLLAA
jgi:uncharacterized protein